MISGLALFQFCTAPKTTYVNSNNQNLYKRENHELSSSYVVYHENDSITKLYFNIPNQNLIYKRPDTSSYFYAAIRVGFLLRPEVNSKKILDSGTVTLFDRQSENIKDKNLRSVLPMKAFLGKTYIAEVTITDLTRKTKNRKIIEIQKSTRLTGQNFNIRKRNDELAFNNYFGPGDTVYLKNNDALTQELYVDYFYREFPLAPPPFSVVERSAFNYKADSSFSVKVSGGAFKLIIPNKGFFHVKAAPTVTSGITLYCVEPAFPGIKNENEMIKSTRYIMSKKEYEDCLTSTDKKAAIDEFWKDIGGSNERAKELLKKYYGRVTEANKLFTSHQSGWQTDRGMIYVIFGPPNSTYKYDTGEQWIYGNEAQPNAIRFDFVKVNNPFSDNDLVLQRSEYYKDVWYQAVNYWRQGHIYLDN